MRREGDGFESLRPADEPEAAPRTAGRGPRIESSYGRLRPRLLPELVDLAFEVLRDRFAVFVGVSALLWAPVRLAQPFIGAHVWMEGEEVTQVAGMLAGTGFNMLAQALVDSLASASVALLVATQLGEERVGVGEALGTAARRLLPLLVIALIFGVLTSLGCMCLIVPGVFLTWRFFLAPTVCVLERASIGTSLNRSYDLAAGSFGVWAGAYLVIILLTSVLTSVAVAGDHPVARPVLLEKLGMGAGAFDALLFGVSTLFFGVATSIKAVLATVFYFHCRARRDGADLERELGRLREASA